MGAGGGANSRLGIRFPKNPDQAKHIFRNAKGHLENDTFENRKMFLDVTNDSQNFMGKDGNGVEWYNKINEDNSQIWVKVKNGSISDAGVNTVPRVWDSTTGYSKNPSKE
jgi:hypothetical protein